MSQNAPTRSRVVRVFVSSTFRDIETERDILAKRTFPELRERCRRRGLEFVEVDLRWGVTREQAERGETLPICLEEIEHCRPYFIGFLGERYGWVPDHIDEELLERQPWLREHLECSITELEILHGVLRDPDMAERSYFYFRDPSYVTSLPEPERARFTAGSPEAAAKLRALKNRIRESDLPVVDGYLTPEAACDEVLDDLWKEIDAEFPEGAKPSPLDLEAEEHEAFAESRARIYVGRSEYFERLDAHAAGDTPPLVVLGEAGSGKSALLANWVRRFRASRPDVFVLQHYIGGTAQSTDYAAILRRIMGELKRRFGIEGDVPGTPEALNAEFPNWLSMAAARGRTVLVLDGLNQLEDRDSAPDLYWLPEHFPPEVRLVLSALPGRSLDALQRREWPTFEVQPLTPDERRRFISDYLGHFRKTLSNEQLGRIASNERTGIPLYLRVLLEELRVFGSFEDLDRRISHYLAAPTIDALYGLVLERLECDYDRGRLGLVRDATSLIWISRRGLAESELLDLLGTDGERLPRAVWSPLYLALRESLVSRSGLLTFFHNYLRQAVERKYVPDEGMERKTRLQLADYFDGQDLTDRKVAELPWQLAQTGEWQRLYALLEGPAFLEHVWAADEYDARSYWARIESNSGLRMTDAYRPFVVEPGAHTDHLHVVARLLVRCGNLEEALGIRSYLVKYGRELGDKDELQVSLGEQAAILYLRGDLDGALELYKEHERLCRELGHKSALSASLGNQAATLSDRGDLDGAMELLKEQERLCRELGHKGGLQYSLGNQAHVLRDRGDLDGAMELRREQERLCRELGHKDGLSNSLGNQAAILRDRGDLDGALELYKEQERLCRELGNKDGLQHSLAGQARILRERGDLDGAMELLKEQERLCRELGHKGGLQYSLGNQAIILRERGDLDGAMELRREEERLCRELGRKDWLSNSLGNQAVILRDRGDLDGAMELRREQERLCRELGHTDGLSNSLDNQAVILRDRGDLDGAMELLKKQEQLCRELGNKGRLSTSLGNQALVLRDRGDLDGALELYKEQERLCRELGHRDGLSNSLGNQAAILRDRGDLDGAMELLKEQEQLCRGLGDKGGLSTSLGNQALVLRDRGDLDGAMELLNEREQLCRELGDRDGLRGSLGSQAVILHMRGNLDGALELYKEQERLCRELGNKGVLSASLAAQAVILLVRGDLDGAMGLLMEQERLCRELGNKDGLQHSLGNQAIILRARGDLDSARELLKEQERLCRELGSVEWLQRFLLHQASILNARGDLDGAMELLKEQERLCRELAVPSELCRSLITQAGVLASDTARRREAVRLAESAWEVAEQHGLEAELALAEALLTALREQSGNGGPERE